MKDVNEGEQAYVRLIKEFIETSYWKMENASFINSCLIKLVKHFKELKLQEGMFDGSH